VKAKRSTAQHNLIQCANYKSNKLQYTASGSTGRLISNIVGARASYFFARADSHLSAGLRASASSIGRASMRISGFDVSVVRGSDGIPLPEVISDSGVFVVADPGTEFEILVAGPMSSSKTFKVYTGPPPPSSSGV